MTDSESLERAIHEAVALVPHDPQWSPLFKAERDRLLELFPTQLIQVEHIGSTAIPDIPAKPIIDILAGVESMATADSLYGPLLDSGYTTSDAFNATLTDRRWFMRYANGHRTHHLHIVVYGSSIWHQRLSFRDALRADPVLARQYALLKQKLATQYHSDREAYTRAKTDFVRSVVGDG
ncbi:hypothetical protein L861_10710 [Litchfieldella anticariensis FP35 = DSM 16096]|uniref:GrpB family protein n=1 Tax=Litchfieldella anticariensis (strain DSM 16096 / CECT 5854 / CIP 108499 / LMG 22089 / FP35) TaxID=1121939 RepID=S2KGH7_LITA3|nr:GrpB family protein [Halomonas anticariensis]EPC01035.1 hypothetical protein L861_10710 [Halomonas anticariensis FP35 = DSM 16096]